MKTRLLTSLCVFFAIIALCIGFTTCQNENLIGLGGKVDLTLPVIEIPNNEPGGYLSGTEVININIADDSGISRILLEYTYLVKLNDGSPEGKIVKETKEIEIFTKDPGDYNIEYYFNEKTGEYVFNWDWIIDTSGMVDGEFSFIVTAWDASKTSPKESKTEKLIYTVKNNAPTLSMQIPRQRTHSNGSINNDFPPSVVTDTYLMGVYEDLAGVAKGFPLIKFWKDGEAEPTNYKQNAGWEFVTTPPSHSNPSNNIGSGWVRPDECAISDLGERGGPIRYYLRTRKGTGEPSEEDTNNGLVPGFYRLKMYVEDINGIGAEWPSYLHPQSADYMLIELVAQGIPPLITIVEPSGGAYYKDNFKIIASAEVQGDMDQDIDEMCFEITGGVDRQGNKLPPVRTQNSGPIILARYQGANITNRDTKEIDIEVGATYYTTDSSDVAVKLPPGSQLGDVNWKTYVTLVDGQYTINVFARGDANSKHTESRQIYIDRNPPRTDISRVSPVYKQESSKFTILPSGNEDYRVFIVNKTIQIDVSATDTFGSAKDDLSGFSKFKYMLLKGFDFPGEGAGINNPENFDDGVFNREKYIFNSIYSHNSAEFIDEDKNPVIIKDDEPKISVKEDGGAYTITLRTHEYAQEPQYDLWLYITAMDGAGNLNFQKILLKVDQNTDRPRISFGNVNSANSPHGLTFMDDLFRIRFSVLDDNGLAHDSIQIRYAVNEANRETISNTQGGWHDLSGIPSEDGLSIAIDDLSLLKIACFLDGHPHNESTCSLDAPHKARLGNENDVKYIMIRAKDDPKTKVYESDGFVYGDTEWRPFRLDLTKPKIVPSTRDASNSGAAAPLPAERTEDNPFGSPVKEGSYRDDLKFAYGDIIEQNLRTISVKINGSEIISYPGYKSLLDPETNEMVDVLIDMDSEILTYNSQLNADDKISIWKGKIDSEWAGELRFRIPIGSFINNLPDGSHSFEIIIEDKALQYDTRTITIYKDMTGPEVNLIVPSVKYSVFDGGGDNKISNGSVGIEDIPSQVEGDLQVNRLKDLKAKIIGNFNDRYSSIFNSGNHQFEYRINNGSPKYQSIHEDNFNKSLVTWEIELPDDLADGTHFLNISVKDIHGNTTNETNLVFRLDRSQPKLTITSITLATQNSKQGFIVKGKVTDTFDFENNDFQVLVGQNSKAKTGNRTKIADREFEFEYFVETEGVPLVNDGYLADFKYGPNTILFNVTGSSGQSAIATGSIILDNKGPDITFNTTGGEKITLTQANVTTTNTTNAATWTDNNLKILYQNRVKDRSAAAKLSGRFTDEYTPIPQAGQPTGSFTFEYVISHADGGYFGSHTVQATASTVDSTSAGWDIPIPENMPDGIYFLTVEVKDRAGNEAKAENMAFMVDRSIPNVSIDIAGGTNPEYDIFSESNMTDKTVTVTVTNTYEVQSLAFNVNNAARATSVSSGLKTFTYTYTFPNAAGLPHGLQNISVTAIGSSDQTRNASRGFNLDIKAPVISISGKDIVNETQIVPPNVTTINTNLNSGDANPSKWTGNLASVYNVRLKDTAEKLTLNFTDDLSPINTTSLWYRINSTGAWTSLSLNAPADSKTASVDIPWSLTSATYRDGLNTLNVRISDTRGNETPATEYNQNIIFMVDTKVPTFAATDNTSTVTGIKVNEVFSGNHVITIEGVVRNVFDVSRLGLIVNTVEQEAQGTEAGNSLEYVHDTNKGGFPFKFNVSTNSFSHGTQSIIINAIGSSGKSTMLSYNVVVDKEGPSITFSTTGSPIFINNLDFASIHGYAYGTGSMGTTQQNEYRLLYAARVTDTSARLTGTFTDEHSEIFAPNSSQGSAYGYWYKIDRINGAGNAIAEGNWIWEQILSPPTNNFTNWTVNLDSSYPDGLYRLSMRVKDRLGNGEGINNNTPISTADNSGKGYQNNMTFMLDRTAPTLSVETVTQGFGPNAGVNNNLNGVYVTGKISNTFEVKGFNIVVAQSEKAAVGNLPAVVGDPTIPSKRDFNYSYWVQIQNDNDFVYGPNTMVVSASGSSGQSDMKTTSTTIDNRGPEISFNTTGGQKVHLTQGIYDQLNSANISASAWNSYRSSVYDTRVKDSSATAKLSGRFTDDYTAIPAAGTGNYTFHYRITGDSAWNSVPSNIEWKTSPVMNSSIPDARSVPWEIILPVSMQDGLYRLSIGVKDRGGFGSAGEEIAAIDGTYYGYEADMAFMINRSTPVLIITDLSGNPLSQDQVFNGNNEISFRGTITGTYAVDNFRLTKTDGAIEALSFTQTGQRTFTVNNKVLQDASALPGSIKLEHGEQNISISLTGSSDLASNFPYRFIVDAEGPVVEIRGREKIFESGLGSGNTVSSINTGLKAGSNPTIWSNSLKTIFDERMTDTNTKLTITFFDNFSAIKADSFSYRINEALGYTPLTIPAANITNNGRNAFVDIPWASKDLGYTFVDGLNKLDILIRDDKTNETTETSIVFMVDAETPEIANPVLLQNAQQTEIYSGSYPITVTGVIKKVYNVNRVDIRLGGIEIAEMGSDTLYAGSHPSGATLSAYDSGKGGYEFEFTLPSTALTHGTKSIMINAAGTSGKSALQNINIIVDSEGPSITFNTVTSDTTNKPIYLSDAELAAIQGDLTGNTSLNSKRGELSGSAIKDQSARLMGNFIDDYSSIFNKNAAENEEYGYYYKIDKLNADNSIIKGNWHWHSVANPIASTSAGWSISLETDQNKYGFPFDDGYYRLSIRVKDRLNNGYGAQKGTQISEVIPGEEIDGGDLGYQNNMAFYMERGIPQIKITSVVPSFTNKGFDIIGEVWNASVSILSVSLDGTEKYRYVGSANAPGFPNNIIVTSLGSTEEIKSRSSFKVEILTADLITEKSYPVMITVTGGSGQSNMVAANFTYDKTAPEAEFRTPTLGGTIVSDGTLPSDSLSNNGKYSIVISTGDWFTGETKIGGTAEDNNGIDKIYYRIGKLSTNIRDGANSTARENLYENPGTWLCESCGLASCAHSLSDSKKEWLDTGLDGASSGFATGWTGGLYNWTYTNDMNTFEHSLLREEDVDGNTSIGDYARAFYMPVYVKIVDRAGNINVLHYKLKVDPEADRPKIVFAVPESDGKQVGGELRVTGTATDNIFIHSVEIRISTVLLSGETNSHPTSGGNRFTLINGKYYYKNTTDVWAYPDNNEGWIKAKLQGIPDAFVSWFYSINGDGLLSPPAGQLRNVLIEARALDSTDRLTANNMISRPLERPVIFDSSVPTISTPLIKKAGMEDQYFFDGIKTSERFTVVTHVEDEGGINLISASQTGTSTLTPMVRNGQVVTGSELAAITTLGWKVTPPQIQQHNETWESGWRYYIINPGNNVNWSAMDVTGSSKEYGAGSMIQYNGTAKQGSGAVVIKANVGTKATGSDLQNANANAANWNTQRFSYTLEFEVNSTSLPGLDYGRTGSYGLNIQVEDNNTGPAGAYKANGLYTIAIDNFYPSTTMTTHYNASTQNFYISGIARDYLEGQSISVQGLSRVLVYFSRNVTGTFTYKGANLATGLPANTPVYFNHRGVPIGYMNASNVFVEFNQTDAFYSSGNGSAHSSAWATIPAMTTTRTNIINRDTDSTTVKPNVSNFPFPVYAIRAKGGNLGNIWESPHAMVIDSQELGASEDLDVDGTYAEMWAGIADKEWQARLDTTNFTDGPLNVHYIVMDEAGNSTHSSKRIYIGNNRPLVRDINLGTDMGRRGTINAGTATNNTWGAVGGVAIYDYDRTRGWGDRLENPLTVTTGSDTVSTDIYSNTGVIAANFRIRNYAFNVVLNTLFGNGQKKYSVSYVSNRTDIRPSEMVEGNVYTIWQQGNVDWRQYGALDGNAGTTFVATGKPDVSATGRVYSYTLGTGNAIKTGDFATTGSATDPENKDRVSNIIFNNFTGITDSDKDLAGDIPQANRNQKFFLIKVYDSTVEGGAEIDQLAHAFAISLDIDNDDRKRPSISVNPFYWESATRNSLYNNSRYNGHIELEADLPSTGTNPFTTAGTGVNDRDPKVSGQVSIRGTSFDNNIIQDINFRISNHAQQTAQQTNSITIGTNTYYRAATYANGWGSVPVGPFTSSNQDNSVYNASGWKFVIESQTLNMDGHTVNWRLDFDSSFITNTASSDNIFTIVARDSLNNSNPSNPGTWAANMQTTENAKTEHYRFDVVPYIREVVTPLSLAYKAATSSFNRSATGWYPVKDSKSAADKIGIKGFNLNGDNMTITVDGVTLNGRATAATGDDMFVSAGTASNPASTTKTHVVARMHNSATLTDDSTILSGALLVRVNNIDSLNNRNNNAAGRINGEVGTGYNDEPNNINNNILNDDRNMYVWSVGSLLNKSPSSVTDRTKVTLESPSFRMNESGRRLLAYANYPSQPGTVHLDNNGTSIDRLDYQIEENLNRYAYVMVAADTNLNSGYNNQNWYVGTSNTTSNIVTYYNLHTRRFTSQANDASSELNGRGRDYKTRISANRTHNGNRNNGRGGVSSGGNVYDRIRLPRIHSRSTDTNASTIVMSYGDGSNDNDIYLHYGTVRNTGTGTNDANIVPIFGGDYSNNKDGAVTSGNNSPIVDFEAMDQRVTDSTQNNRTTYPYRGSMYTASASLSNGIPVIAWYDADTLNLVISYGTVPAAPATETTTATTSTVTWQARATVVQSNAGPFVDMAVDAGNNVHLAYYDNNGGLCYAYIPATGFTLYTTSGTAGTAKVSGIKTYRVDTFLSAGLKIMINVREENGTNVPYISYYHGAFPETKFTVRTAWPVLFTGGVASGDGTDELDFFTGNWEVMTVPVENTPLNASAYNELIIANGVPKTSDNWVELSNTATGTTRRLSAYNYTYTNNKNVHRTILVGYMTLNHYEGAILKKNLW